MDEAQGGGDYRPRYSELTVRRRRGEEGSIFPQDPSRAIQALSSSCLSVNGHHSQPRSLGCFGLGASVCGAHHWTIGERSCQRCAANPTAGQAFAFSGRMSPTHTFRARIARSSRPASSSLAVTLWLRGLLVLHVGCAEVAVLVYGLPNRARSCWF